MDKALDNLHKISDTQLGNNRLAMKNAINILWRSLAIGYFITAFIHAFSSQYQDYQVSTIIGIGFFVLAYLDKIANR